ncbi:MAG: PfkB family carbohydrate kinase, partial [Pseudomonadota bacterium]
TATGTHLSHPRVEAATLKALRLARENGSSTALDIDYRPNLWGLASHDAGESRFIESQAVTDKLQSTLYMFDLIVGTEEEFHIAGGSTDTVAALRTVRQLTPATLVCKRGPTGAVAFEGEIPDNLDEGVSGPGFPIEVFNVLGAGDGFMAGLLRGWLRGELWNVSLKYANACGALAVSRHGCTPAYPSWDELNFFLDRSISTPALRHDQALEQRHWSTTRRSAWPSVRVFAFDHRSQFEDMADAAGADHDRIGVFKSLCMDAALEVSQGRPGYGILCDNRLGRTALHSAADHRLWVGRPAEHPASRPLRLEGEIGLDFGSALSEWPLTQTVKVLCFAHPDDDDAMWREQLDVLSRLAVASRRNRLELLVEVIPSKVGPVDDATTADVIERIYSAGIFPDWWKLEPSTSAQAWTNLTRTIEAHDAHTRGIMILGLDAPLVALEESFSVSAEQPLVRGFAVGRTIFGEPARSWFAGDIDDAVATARMAETYRAICDLWDQTQRQKGRAA